MLSAIITFFFIQPLTTDGMEVEDRKVWFPYSKFGIFMLIWRQFREYLESHGYDTSAMGLPGTESENASVEEEKGTENEKKSSV